MTAASRKLVLLGGGQHATVVVDAARSSASPWEVVGFFNDGPTARMDALAVPWLGDDPRQCPQDAWLIVATGSPGVSNRRSDLVARFAGSVARGWATVVHERAWVSPTATIDAGTLVCAQAVVNPGAMVGRHCIVNTGAIVEHDGLLGDYVHMAPGAVLGGGVTVGNGSFLGLGCRVRDHVKLGERITVAMGAVVIGSVADDQTVLGVPARPWHRGP
ncbi:MAG: acetyltransferase [Myxococcales bacterium]